MTQQCLIKFNAVIRNAWISYNYGGKCCNQRRCLSVASSVAFSFFKYSSSLVVIFVFLSLPFLIELPCWVLQSVAAFPSLPPLYLPHPHFFKNDCSGGVGFNQWQCFPLYLLLFLLLQWWVLQSVAVSPSLPPPPPL